jgi:hypothetical protein
MNAIPDEQELERLLGLLSDAATGLSPEAPAREAIVKGMLSLLILFAEDRREELEEAYLQAGGKRTQTTTDLLFELSDPEQWVRTLEEFPELKEKILSSEAGDRTMGAFLKNAINEVEKRKRASNVQKFPKRTD